jgi:hypothetical protein
MEQENKKSTGISLSVIVFLVFFVLKMTSYINWSWLWVLSPLWIPFALVFVVICLGTLSALLKLLQEKLENWNKNKQ